MSCDLRVKSATPDDVLVVPEAAYPLSLSRLRVVEGHYVSSKSPSRTWDRDYGVAKRKEREKSFLMRGCLPGEPRLSPIFYCLRPPCSESPEISKCTVHNVLFIRNVHKHLFILKVQLLWLVRSWFQESSSVRVADKMSMSIPTLLPWTWWVNLFQSLRHSLYL